MNQIKRKIFTLLMLILILIGIFLTALAFDQRVSFTDDHLELAIREEIGNLGKPIYQSQLHDIIILDLSGKGIHDLSGLAHLMYLERLNLDDNPIEDLSPLKSIRNLYAISLNNTGIIDLQEVGFDAISHLPLVELSLENNVYISKVGAETRLSDITLLEKFKDLEVLRLNHNHIQDLSPLANLMKLSELELRNNHIERIDPLANLTHLQKLDLSRNQIEEIDFLSSFSQLHYLNLRENRVTDVSPLTPLYNLTYLNLHSNQDIQSINPISGLTQLTNLILENISIEDDIWAIQGMSELVHLNLQNCGIEDYEVIGSLMAQGALQDDLETNQQATVNIRDNLLPDDTSDPLTPIRPFWDQRRPHAQPFPYRHCQA
jgi:internalin A